MLCLMYLYKLINFQIVNYEKNLFLLNLSLICIVKFKYELKWFYNIYVDGFIFYIVNEN